jgi:hypothetical protein
MQYEYDVEIVHADVKTDESMAFLSRRWPGREFSRYAVESTVPALNRRGGDGWELVSMEPVVVGDKGDVKMPVGDPGSYWTATYLAVWRRGLSDRT